MLKPSQFKRGFSLIELLVTIAVLAILLAAVSPSISDLMANLRLRGTAEGAMAGLQKARAEAVKSNQIVTFWLMGSVSGALDNSCQLSSTSGAWVVAYDDPSGACANTPSTDTAPRIVQVGNVANGNNNLSVAALNAASAGASQLSFNGYGRRQDATSATDISTIDFTSATTGTRRLRLEISPAGGIRMCDRDVPTTTPPDPKACN